MARWLNCQIDTGLIAIWLDGIIATGGNGYIPGQNRWFSHPNF